MPLLRYFNKLLANVGRQVLKYPCIAKYGLFRYLLFNCKYNTRIVHFLDFWGIYETSETIRFC